MDYGFTPPQPLVFEGNLAEQWKKWKQELNFHLIATETNDKSDAIKSNILLKCIGKKGREVYNTFTLQQIKITPRKNIAFSRYTFFTCRQKEGESFDDFVTNLKKLSQYCEFGTLCDSLIRNVIIIGIIDNR